MESYKRLAGKGSLSDYDRVRLTMFAAYLASSGQTLEAVDLRQYGTWLQSWGFPPAGAEIHTRWIAKRIAAM